ncbi:UPF0518 protein GF15501 [Eumeta japonica]|uniref:UPF0518 protein GF15501 n=1 Tax=Eumeta variegata TaxID=151549 RepID=A0A4C1XAY1_EUMVA|nr:UPF0518 protein GF15501 [Eumeta japonica]
MSWLRSTSLSLARQLTRSLEPRDYEPQACYSSFCKHWQQAYDIIIKSQPQHLHDDVLGVVNHLEQLGTLLVLEARAREINTQIGSPVSCLEYLLSENLLDKLYEWAVCTGKYENAVRLEELKLFSSLISHYSSQVIAAEPFLRPLLKLLSGFRNELPPVNIESQLVTVLNQLCVALMQNLKFIDLFFLTAHMQNGSQSEFIIVRLLLSSVHREGSVGASARDALLLCAKMSAKSDQLAHYMLNVSNTCPVLATGLSGLYSLLPRTLNDKIYRLCPDDVNQVHKLTLFIDSLEFCNAVAQVAHSSIKNHLLDLVVHGFLVPVMGPALLQTRGGALQSGAAEQAAATAYLELSLRCVTVTGLMKTITKFLMQYLYDGVRVIDMLLRRLDGSSQLSLVTLSLMETLIDLNCEDVMLELVYKYLLGGNHFMPHIQQLLDPELYRESAIAFLDLSPKCCLKPLSSTREWSEDLFRNGRRILDFSFKDDNEERWLQNAINEQSIMMNNLVQEVSFNYGAEKNNNSTVGMRRLSMKGINIEHNTKEQDSLMSVCTNCDNKNDVQNIESPEKEVHSLTSLNDGNDKIVTPTEIQNGDSSGKEHDSLTSIGESSGYESFRYRAEDSEDQDGYAEDSFWKHSVKMEVCGKDYGNEIRNCKGSTESTIGPLLSSLLKKIASMLDANLIQNLQVTGLISKLVSFPTPLLSALLLSPGFVLRPWVPSLFQLKAELDELTAGLYNTDVLVDKARVYLIQQELSLAKTRTYAHDQVATPQKSDSLEANTEDSSLRRGDRKRRSFTSISLMFGRRLSNSSPSPNTSLSSPHSTASYPRRREDFTEDSYWDQSIAHRAVLNAVLLDEWLKELSALALEHSIALSADITEDDHYIRTVL